MARGFKDKAIVMENTVLKKDLESRVQQIRSDTQTVVPAE